jgi:hypothetical protein
MKVKNKTTGNWDPIILGSAIIDNSLDSDSTTHGASVHAVNTGLTAIRNYVENENFVSQSDVESMISQAISNARLAAHPIGSIEVNVSGTNPGTYLGGTWKAFGSGRTLVGVNTSDTSFNTVEKTGGEKTHTLTINEMPKHSHGITVKAHWNGFNNRNEENYNIGTKNDTNWANRDWMNYASDTGGGQSHNNLQPYITVYFWKRVS